jgi:hypothetical protein
MDLHIKKVADRMDQKRGAGHSPCQFLYWIDFCGGTYNGLIHVFL